jgi:hypothetical protein
MKKFSPHLLLVFLISTPILLAQSGGQGGKLRGVWVRGDAGRGFISSDSMAPGTIIIENKGPGDVGVWIIAPDGSHPAWVEILPNSSETFSVPKDNVVYLEDEADSNGYGSRGSWGWV